MIKFTARVLSIIMFITAIATNYSNSMFVQDIYANINDINFNSSFTKALEIGPNDSVPIESTITGNDTVWLDWDMNNFNESTFSTGDFMLSYPIDDGQEVRFSIEKQGDDEAVVTYRLYDTATGNPLPTYSNGYSIYTHKVNRYVTLNDYISQGYNSSVTNYQVLDTDTMGNAIDYPSFIVGTNYGFSFKYNNVDVHFKWNKSDSVNKMYFYTNQLKKGYIVETDLSVTVGGTTKDYKKIISSGVSEALFTALPYANVDKYSGDIIEVDDETDKFPSNDEEDRGIDVTFKSLKAWDESTNTYTATPDKVPVTIKFTSLEDNQSFTVSIDDISMQSNATLTTTNKEAVLKDYQQIGDMISFKVGGLSDGVIYETTIDVLPDLSIADESLRLSSNSTEIEFGKVYTFPKYEIISQNNKLYIVSQPFYGYSGEFLLKTSISEKVSSRQESDGINQLIFPLAINSQNMFSEYYRLYFSPGKVFEDTASANTSNTIHSQKLYYKPITDTSGITIPNNFYIVEYNHIKDDSVSDLSKGFLEITYRWDIGIKEDIDKMFTSGSSIDVNYELSETLTPDTANIERVADINLHIEKIGEELYVTYSGGDEGVDENNIANYVVNREQEKLNFKYQQDSATNVYYAETTLLFKTAVSDYSGVDANEIYFRYPNIYFFTVNPTQLNGEDINISASVFKSITLNYLKDADLNPPQNISLTDNTYTSINDGDEKDEISFNINFSLSGQSMNDYLTSIYSSDKIDKVLDETKFKSYFNIYISEDESKLTGDFVEYDYNERSDNVENVTYNSSWGDTVYLSDIGSNKGITTDTNIKGIEVLRNEDILKISNYPISTETLEGVLNTGTSKSYIINLDGLDPNTKYYISLDLVVEDLENDTLDYSDITPINAITTKSQLDTLKPGESVPSAPDFFEIETEKDKTLIGWTPITPESSDEVAVEIEYELLRLKDIPMENEYLDTRESFNTTWNDYINDSDKVGFRTKDANILTYNNTTFVESDEELYQYSAGTTPITLTDQTLVPNTIYYYYIRTVKIINDEELYSIWEPIAVTTSNVEGPINLEAMFDEYDEDIDLKSEVYLKFDAPIKDLSHLGTIYNIELSMMKDGEEWQSPVVINGNNLIAGNTIDEDGYRTFIYKVNDLEPGTSYTFRVRMTLIEENAYSLYSNSVRIRTETDQDDYDKEDKVDNWEDYVKDALDDILNGNYWEISNTISNKEFVYREEKFDGLLKSVNDGFLLLADSEQNKYNHYYIPVNSLIKANNEKIGFKVKSGDVTVSLSSNAIDTTLNNSLKPLAKDLKDKDFEDYYLDIIVKTENSIDKINGNSISSPIIEVKVVTKAFDTNIKEFESDVYRVLMEEFIDEELSEDIREEIEELLEDEKSNEDIIKALKSEIQDYAEDAMEKVEEIFDDNTSAEKYNREIALFDAPIIITNPNSDTESKPEGYKQVGDVWVKENVTSYGNNNMIIAYTGGVYVFTSTSIIISDIGNIEDATKAHYVLVKYDLYDILKGSNGINASKLVSRYEAYQSVAKILGNISMEGDTYLKSLGMNISTRNTSSPITEEELVYLMMNIYEYKTNTKINNYQIKNYNNISKISNVSSKYLKSVQVAVDLGIISLDEFSSKEQVTTENFLNTILNIGSKVGI